ncbi:MAG TPA: SAM hydroxide adenosyltransferase [Methylosinus sp.]
MLLHRRARLARHSCAAHRAPYRQRRRARRSGAHKGAGRPRYRRTFGDVPPGTPLVYVDSLFDMAVALDLANFAERYGVGSGPDWTIDLSRAP